MKILVVALFFVAFSANAQVAVDSGALDSLDASPEQGAKPSSSPPGHRVPNPHHSAAPSRKIMPPASRNQPKPATVAPSPPQAAIVPAPTSVPLRTPSPIPAIPVSADAPGSVRAQSGGLRIGFGPSRADLSPATVTAIQNFLHQSPSRSLAQIEIIATAANIPDDPSTPRRLSLQRGLALRAVLLHNGIDSAHIFVKPSAPMSDQPDSPADYADLRILPQSAVP